VGPGVILEVPSPPVLCSQPRVFIQAALEEFIAPVASVEM
jgi:hypothetical protein